MFGQKLILNKSVRVASPLGNRFKSIGSKSIVPIATLIALIGVAIWNSYIPTDRDSAVTAKPFTPKLQLTPKLDTFTPKLQPFTPTKLPVPQQRIVGIYSGRYRAQDRQDEQSVRSQVRYYHTQGINTLIVGVWGNGCAMYHSKATKKLLGQSSCPNKFPTHWLDWTIDEAHQQGMQVHAYFERGIKIDNSSPIYDRAVARNWLVPGIDRTYPGMDQRVFDVEHPEVIALYHGVMTEFVTRYSKIDAVQWDDFLAYSVKLPGANRAAQLTKFANNLVKSTKQANPKVSFDLCTLNPDWSKLHYSANWKQWHIDRSFVELYNEPTFDKELAKYAEKSDGIAITDRQLHRLPALLKNPKIKGILIFPLDTNQQTVAKNVRLALSKQGKHTFPNTVNPPQSKRFKHVS
jgi:uncharacterized lipoprotein YddW (UPF0748 family)